MTTFNTAHQRSPPGSHPTVRPIAHMDASGDAILLGPEIKARVVVGGDQAPGDGLFESEVTTHTI